jgi:DNA-binding response OmpR family regulator
MGLPSAAPIAPPIRTEAERAAGGGMPVALVVDDEPAMRTTLAYNLRRIGCEVRLAADATAALSEAQRHTPDIVLLDVLLPGGINGFEVCRLLRREVRCPIILLSALGDEIDRVVGLEVGADDYVTKPFSMVELMARVKAQLRRTRMVAEVAMARAAGAANGSRAAPRSIQVGDLVVDPVRREVRVGREVIELKRRQFDLLHYLARHAGMTVSRAQLLDAIWPDLERSRHDTRTVDVHVHRVRRSVERDPERPRFLHTVRGIGYVLKDLHGRTAPAHLDNTAPPPFVMA